MLVNSTWEDWMSKVFVDYSTERDLTQIQLVRDPHVKNLTGKHDQKESGICSRCYDVMNGDANKTHCGHCDCCK